MVSAREPAKARRYLERAIQIDALADRKMAFISGPRQVGKTTLGRALLSSPNNVFSWDDQRFRRAWARDPVLALEARGPGPVLLDEIHKDRRWKTRLKGVYDLRGESLPLVVTGSARLDYFRRGGDSLMGRYLPYRLHPFSVAEGSEPVGPDAVLQAPRVQYPWCNLLRLGGFPEPLLAASEHKARRWSRLRTERIVQEEVRDFRHVHDLQALRVLVDLLPDRVGSLLSVNALREDVGVAYATVRDWVLVLESLYHGFFVRPHAGRLSRALRAEPKLYLFDVLAVADPAARRENLAALHLLKACQYWTDTAQGDFELRFVRTKDGEEVDFLLLRDRRPWMLVECKTSDTTPSRALVKFARLLGTAINVQLVDRKGYDRLLPEPNVRVMDTERFFAMLV